MSGFGTRRHSYAKSYRLQPVWTRPPARKGSFLAPPTLKDWLQTLSLPNCPLHTRRRHPQVGQLKYGDDLTRVASYGEVGLITLVLLFWQRPYLLSSQLFGCFPNDFDSLRKILSLKMFAIGLWRHGQKRIDFIYHFTITENNKGGG